MGKFSSVIRLRRDNEYNYAKIENTFIPSNGEVCLVDTPKNGLRAKVGDGLTVWKNLEYSDVSLINQINGIVIRGYYSENEFYLDIAHTIKAEASLSKIYIDATSSKIYSFNGEAYEAISGGEVSNATAENAGIMKLYETTGQNVDGTMTQKAITDELNEKFEIDVNHGEEMIIFANNF